MEDNSHQMNSKTYTKHQRLRGSCLLLTIHNWKGLAERKNRTIMEATRAMLHDQDLPMHLWAEAARTAVYVRTVFHT